MKSKGLTEKDFLTLLNKVLQAKMPDHHLGADIYDEVIKQVSLIKSLQSFEKFCEKGGLPNIEEETVAELKSELTEKFGEGSVDISPAEDKNSVEINIALEDRTISNKVRVQPPGTEDDIEEKPPFVPFPVSLPEDPDLVWVLARREDLGPDEAARSLASIEEEFWATKSGQKLLRDRVDRTFAEFIANVPASALVESGLKRHYKEPETLKTLRLLPAISPANR
jgi:hypothetical protein